MAKKSIISVLVILMITIAVGFNSRILSILRGGNDLIQNDTLLLESHSVKPDWAEVYDTLNLQNIGLSQSVFQLAWNGFKKIKLENPVIAIADFSKSSREKRLYVIDLENKKLIFNTYVAHGRNSGDEYANRFSNRESSYQSSLGFYRTLDTYMGKHGLSLRLEGLEKGINDLAYQRAIVMHGAGYVSEKFIKNTGRLGRSLGCPAVSEKDHKMLINVLRGGGGLFIYSPDKNYLTSSSFLENHI
jgi:hypothetical protein